MRDFLLGLKWINLLLSLIFEVGRHKPLTWILKWEDMPLIWTTPSAGSLYKGMEEGSLYSLPACSHLTIKSVLHWCSSQLIPEYAEGQLRETFSLLG